MAAALAAPTFLCQVSHHNYAHRSYTHCDYNTNISAIQGNTEETLKPNLQENKNNDENVGFSLTISLQSDTYSSILQTCKTVVLGKQIHAHMIKSGSNGNAVSETKLITMYANCTNLDDARMVFDKISARNVFSWSAMIRAYAKHGCCEKALALFYQLQCEGLELESFVFPSVLKACAHLQALQQGRGIHSYLIRRGFLSDISVCNALVDMYSKCKSLEDAQHVFDKMPERDLVSWNAMITGYAVNGFVDEALKLFGEMRLVGVRPDMISWNGMIGGFVRSGHGVDAMELFCSMQMANVKPNPVTIVEVLAACAEVGALQVGREIHGYVIRHEFEVDVHIGNALIDMYRKCGCIGYARQVFDKMSPRNTVSWNMMIAGYFQQRHADEAMKLFHQMELDGVKRSTVSWNAMIAGYAQNGRSKDALKLFQQMRRSGVKPTSFTFGSILLACANLAALDQGRQIHSYIITTGFESSVFVGSALVDMYAKSQSIGNALQIFDRMSEKNTISWNAMIAGYAQNDHGCEALKLFQQMQLAGVKPDVISWNAMISGYAQNGHGNEALRLFYQMQLAGIKPNPFTFGSVLSACAKLAALDHGKEIHAYTVRSGFEVDKFVESALIDMYAKCGSIENACGVFDKASANTVISWNSMIGGYAMHGHIEDALSMFHKMQKAGVKPDHITFIGVLSSCSQAGLIHEGWHYFDCMKKKYNITPSVEHYACMVDLLGRAGQLNEAHDFIKAMPLEPDASIWGSLLGACRVHCNTELGQHAAEHLFKIEPENEGNYILLSNIYATAGRWDDFANIRKIMRDRGLKSRPGCSWIEVKNRLLVFHARDRSHPETEKIYATLESLARCMKEAGYMPSPKLLLHDVE